ncbi:NUDIX hydrolase [Flindersiella endophytica]
MSQYSVVIDVLLILTRGDEVLLALRQGTGYADGCWNVPSGKLEAGEPLEAALRREAHEEIGLSLAPGEAQFVSTVHYRNQAEVARIGFFFHATHDPLRHGEPVNAEPHKCAKIAWYPLDAVPETTYPYTTAGIVAFRRGERLVHHGWS